MIHSQTTVRDLVGAIHWATEDLLAQMKGEAMSDDGYAVYRRFVDTRERMRREFYTDTGDTCWDIPEPCWDDDF